jgi:hypothetical protein
MKDPVWFRKLPRLVAAGVLAIGLLLGPLRHNSPMADFYSLFAQSGKGAPSEDAWMLVATCSKTETRQGSRQNPYASRSAKTTESVTVNLITFLPENLQSDFSKTPPQSITGDLSASEEYYEQEPYKWRRQVWHRNGAVISREGYATINITSMLDFTITAAYDITADDHDTGLDSTVFPAKNLDYQKTYKQNSASLRHWHIDTRKGGIIQKTSDGSYVFKLHSNEIRPDNLFDTEGTITTAVDIEATLGHPPESEGYMTVLEPMLGSLSPGLDKYKEWRPRGGKSAKVAGSMVGLIVRLRKPGTTDTPPRKMRRFRVRFELPEVSREPGLCLNWPPGDNSDDKSPDLRFDQRFNPGYDIPGEGLTATSKNAGEIQIAYLSCYDWGAYGKVKATLIYEDDKSEKAARIAYLPDRGYISIPYDENQNHIADSWEESVDDEGAGDPLADDDKKPDNAESRFGDGLTYYEEYRGFMVKGKHISTDPTVKDVFIYDENRIGIGHFANSGLNIHLIDENEGHLSASEGSSWVINPNAETAHGVTQHLLHLEAFPLKDGVVGEVRWDVGLPKDVRVVMIDVWQCLRLKYPMQRLKSTIAHELGHACSLDHHGCGDYKVSLLEMMQEDGKSWRTWAETKEATITIAVPGGQNSGDVNCVMNYNNGEFIEADPRIFRWKVESDWHYGTILHDNPPGTTFCGAKQATGYDAARLGNATQGECGKHMDVNDRHTARPSRCAGESK